MSYSLNEALALLLRPGTLSVIAGRARMGATSLAIQALRKAKSGRVLFFSLDEPAARIRERSGGRGGTRVPYRADPDRKKSLYFDS